MKFRMNLKESLITGFLVVIFVRMFVPGIKNFQLKHLIKDFHPQNKELNLDEVIEMNEEEFKEKFKTSPIKRAKLKGLKRNASFLKKQ